MINGRILGNLHKKHRVITQQLRQHDFTFN